MILPNENAITYICITFILVHWHNPLISMIAQPVLYSVCEVSRRTKKSIQDLPIQSRGIPLGPCCPCKNSNGQLRRSTYDFSLKNRAASEKEVDLSVWFAKFCNRYQLRAANHTFECLIFQVAWQVIVYDVASKFHKEEASCLGGSIP